MVDWDRLVDKFFSLEDGHSYRCRYHYGAHWQDEITRGRWYLHGHLIAEYKPPRLWLSDAGYPTITTMSRLAMVLNRWWKIHMDSSSWWWEIRKFSTEKTLLCVLPLKDGRARFYRVDGIVLEPAPDGLHVLKGGEPAREVVPATYASILPVRYHMPGFGVIGATDGKIFLKTQKGRRAVYEELTLEELKSALRKAMSKLGWKSRRLAVLIILAGKEEDVGVLIERAS